MSNAENTYHNFKLALEVYIMIFQKIRKEKKREKKGKKKTDLMGYGR